MKVLGIETATIVCAAAVVENRKLLSEKYLTEPHIHSEKLLTVIRQVLHTNKYFDALAISIGPGSFTGLRIGLSVAKGLAFASGKPLLAISTLEALALNFIIPDKVKQGALICPLIDARRDEFYTALYRADGNGLSTIMEPQAKRFGELLDIFPDEELNFIGDGVEKFKNLSQGKRLDKNFWIFADGLINLCSAASVALLGEKKLLKNEIENLAELEPVYIKDFQTITKTQHG
jgi:tRNA threonylcarbamoyladenosine biosynthesis protein TsaB